MSDAANIRKLWELVESEGILQVVQVVQGPQWILLLRVPWCRFAREAGSEQQYRRVLEEARRQPAAPAEVRHQETQMSLFGDPA